MDLDEKGGLDYEEFKQAVAQLPTQLEKWASMLPLAGMLASSLPIRGSEGDQALRDFSRLRDEEIETAAEAFKVGLRRLLLEEKAAMRLIFDNVDSKASEAAKASAKGVSAVSKFKTFKMSTGTVADYHSGLSSRIGAPNPNFSKGIQDEHTAMWGCDAEFTTLNYGLRTTPRKEYAISTAARPCPAEDMLDRNGGRVRVIRRLDELRPLKLSQEASLTDDEILAVVLYSGPMFQVYNTILRQFPAEEFERFRLGGNLFATTIAVLQSAVAKLSRSVRLPPGLRLYRGL
eukprot:CAMPEP_0172212760 /NCGR_PEP_ID=MMETSP1050-20130122/37213_1 /TAXON_ID=233186 /ORGANISM="Cryptomonas curvata, Strain CCAP979/52" /LENGTH=288 /DNA_ID=CAMNT_0012893511 /DNA_START=614 /DNA_END=1477 /DNA_ORIENTATION=+